MWSIDVNNEFCPKRSNYDIGKYEPTGSSSDVRNNGPMESYEIGKYRPVGSNDIGKFGHFGSYDVERTDL